jgi:hypothetical protein
MEMRRDVCSNCVSMLTVTLGLLLCCSTSMADEPASRGSEGTVQVSIWDDSNLGINSSAIGLQTASTNDEIQEPILVPLPAPLLAAGTGLGLAWWVRRRMTRS